MTLMEREELQGRNYPMFLERLFLVLAIAIFALYHDQAGAIVEGLVSNSIVVAIGEWCIFPLALLAIAEILGRIIQQVHSD